MGLIGEEVYRLRTHMVERKKTQNAGDSFRLQRIRRNGKLSGLRLPVPLALEARSSLCRIEGLSLGIDDPPVRVANDLLGSKRLKSAIRRPQRVGFPGNRSGEA